MSIALGPFHEPPPAGYGAVEKTWWSVAHELARAGHHVHVSAKGRNAQPRDGVRARMLRGFSATGVLPIDLAKDLIYALHVLFTLPRSDVVVTNSFWLPVLLTPFKHWKGRIVVHVGRFPKGQMWLYRGADLLHTVSSPVASAIAAQCPSLRERIVVLGYPIDTDVFSPAGDESVSAPEVLYVGRIHPEKGLDLLIRAFAKVHQRVPGARLAMVGPASVRSGGGGDAFLRSLRERAAGLPVAFEPAIADERALARRYRQAAVFCYPSQAEKGETFGRSILEAMSCGVPCVVSGLRCFGDFFGHGEHGFMFDHAAGDAEDRLADALATLLSDGGLANRMGANARRRAEHYSLPSIAGSYARMLESVLSRRQTGRAC